MTTAAQDNRVVPWHSYKFAAALQHAQRCDNPVLLRVETRAGHGAGMPVWMQIEHAADQLAFAAAALEMSPGITPGRFVLGAGASSGMERSSENQAPRSISLQRSLQNGRHSDCGFHSTSRLQVGQWTRGALIRHR